MSGCIRATKSAHTTRDAFFCKSDLFYLTMIQTTWKHREGGRGDWNHPVHGYCMVRVEGQARVPNGVKDIVSKISIFFSYIYLYRTNNSL